jgi:hypothetical protein
LLARTAAFAGLSSLTLPIVVHIGLATAAATGYVLASMSTIVNQFLPTHHQGPPPIPLSGGISLEPCT